MTIKDMELLTGLTKANIHFYEREGLIAPPRESNGYRSYGEAELGELRRIRLLRSLGVPIEQIRAMQAGTLGLREAAEGRLRDMAREQREAAASARVCRRLLQEGALYETLEPEAYWASLCAAREASLPAGDALGLPASAEETLILPAPDKAAAPQDTAPRLRCPWQRFFARLLDWQLCYAAVCITAMLLTGYGLDAGLGLVCQILSLLLLLFLEPLALSRWGTTAGKWVMGLHIEHENGGRLTYSAAFTRTGLVIVWGLGLGIPVFNLVRLYRSCQTADAGEALPWDDDAFVYTVRDKRPRRVIACMALFTAAAAAPAILSARDYVPPHRGDMTAVEFAGNYNAVAQHEKMTWAGTLDVQTLEWSSAFRFSDGASVAYPSVRQADFTFDAEGGTLRAVHMRVEASGDGFMLDRLSPPVLCAMLSYAGAYPDMGAFGHQEALRGLVAQHPFESFAYETEYVSLRCEAVVRGGWVYDGVLMANEEGGAISAALSLTMTRK